MENNINEIIKSIFERALHLDKLSREVFFKNLKEEEKHYENDVKSLLEAYETNDDFLEIDSGRDIFSEDNIGPHPLIGKHIGHYLIEEEVGQGGMGIVFSGKRDDNEFDQKVAIKILKQGLSSEYLIKRFENERQTLANLQHPNIAKLFDGGKTVDGLPYLVMEFIDGVPITKYCSENKLSVKKILKLFSTVCEAIQYAHQNLIIHRDIKPENILVNKDGRIKLLDFGLSKLLDKELNANTGLTKTGTWHLTPEYASPEQINGENINTASDTYSLGVLLYRLLANEHPYKIFNVSPLALSKIFSENKISKPSEVVFNKTKGIKESELSIFHSTHKQLQGDLDNIVLKAMHKDPYQRYSSVQDFSDDIKNFLYGMPVSAREDSYYYRFSKFVQRHKVGVTLFILFNVLVITSIAAIIYQGRIAARERDRAKIENEKYEQVNGFLTSILSSVDPSEIGRDVKVYDILDQAAKDVKTDFKDHPEVEASIRSTLGNTYVNLGEYEKGKPFLEKSYKINLAKYGENSKETAASIHDLANYYDWIGEYKIADSLYSKSISIFRNVLTEPSKIFADALNNYGIVLMNFGKYDEAEKLYLEAIDISRKVEGDKSKNLASIYNNLAYSYTDEGKLEKAEKYFKESLIILLELLGKNRPEVGTSYNNLGWLYTQLGKFDSAEVYLHKSYELKYELKGKDHPDVGLALNNLGVIKTRKNEYKEAESYFYKAIEQYKKSYPSDHPLISTSYSGLARVYYSLEEFVKSEEYFRKSLQIKIKKLPKDHYEIFKNKGELGMVLVKNDKLLEAEKLLTESYDYYINNLPNDHKLIQEFLKAKIELYTKKNNTEFVEKYQALLIKVN